MGADRGVKPGRGIVVVLSLDPTVGHEQKGVRPCVVVSAPEVIVEQRYPLVCVWGVSTRSPCLPLMQRSRQMSPGIAEMMRDALLERDPDIQMLHST
jgi:mRNA-degrading endonuclease toxin of MazEF toxin-antitoxin module